MCCRNACFTLAHRRTTYCTIDKITAVGTCQVATTLACLKACQNLTHPEVTPSRRRHNIRGTNNCNNSSRIRHCSQPARDKLKLPRILYHQTPQFTFITREHLPNKGQIYRAHRISNSRPSIIQARISGFRLWFPRVNLLLQSPNPNMKLTYVHTPLLPCIADNLVRRFMTPTLGSATHVVEPGRQRGAKSHPGCSARRAL